MILSVIEIIFEFLGWSLPNKKKILDKKKKIIIFLFLWMLGIVVFFLIMNFLSKN